MQMLGKMDKKAYSRINMIFAYWSILLLPTSHKDKAFDQVRSPWSMMDQNANLSDSIKFWYFIPMYFWVLRDFASTLINYKVLIIKNLSE